MTWTLKNDSNFYQRQSWENERGDFINQMASSSMKSVCSSFSLSCWRGCQWVRICIMFWTKFILKNVYVYTNHIHSSLILNIFDHSFTLPITSHMTLNSELCISFHLSYTIRLKNQSKIRFLVRSSELWPSKGTLICMISRVIRRLDHRWCSPLLDCWRSRLKMSHSTRWRQRMVSRSGDSPPLFPWDFPD